MPMTISTSGGRAGGAGHAPGDPAWIVNPTDSRVLGPTESTVAVFVTTVRGQVPVGQTVLLRRPGSRAGSLSQVPPGQSPSREHGRPAFAPPAQLSGTTARSVIVTSSRVSVSSRFANCTR